MLNINIRVIDTITPNWIHQIQPRQQTTDNTITLGQMGELHYVALENVQEIIRNESRFEEATNQIEDEEDIIGVRTWICNSLQILTHVSCISQVI